MRRSILWAVAIQGGGTALALFTTLAISRVLGAQAQGSFAIIKNWFDLVSATVLIGLPQGLIYTINRRDISPAFAVRVAGTLGAISLVPTVIGTIVGVATGYLPIPSQALVVLALGLGISGYIFHGLSRSIALTQNDGVSFSLLTAMPSIGVALALGLQYAGGHVSIWHAFVASGLLCTLAGIVAIRPALRVGHPAETGWRTTLVRQSAHSFAQSLLTALHPAIIYTVVQSRGTVADVGVLSFALITLTALNALIGMIGPILYNHWSKSTVAQVLSDLRGNVLKVSLATGMATTLLLWLCAPLMAVIAGAGFASAVVLVRILSLSAMPLIFSRLAMPAFMAAGQGMFATQSAALRVVAVAVAIGVCGYALNLPIQVAGAIAWVVSEWVAGLAIFYRAIRAREDSAS